jgi:hypothetical protein
MLVRKPIMPRTAMIHIPISNRFWSQYPRYRNRQKGNRIENPNWLTQMIMDKNFMLPPGR